MHQPSINFKNLKLPSNRWQSFGDILKNRFNILLKIGSILTISGLPLIILVIIRNILIYDIKLALLNEFITVEAAAQSVFQTRNFFNLLQIAAFLLIGLMFSGLIRIIRNLIWQEPIFFASDFKKGLSQNYAHTLLLFLLGGFLFFLVRFLITYGNFISESSAYTWALVFAIVLCVLFLPTAVFSLFQNDLYQLSLKAKLKNSFLLFMRTFLYSFPLIIFPFSFWFLTLLNIGYWFVLVFILGFLLILPITFLAYGEFAFYCFDEAINKTHHPEIYKKGIFTDARD